MLVIVLDFLAFMVALSPLNITLNLSDKLKKVNSLPLEGKIRMKDHAMKRAADFIWEKCDESTMELLLKISL